MAGAAPAIRRTIPESQYQSRPRVPGDRTASHQFNRIDCPRPRLSDGIQLRDKLCSTDRGPNAQRHSYADATSTNPGKSKHTLITGELTEGTARSGFPNGAPNPNCSGCPRGTPNAKKGGVETVAIDSLIS